MTSARERLIAGRKDYTNESLLRELSELADINKQFRERKVSKWLIELTLTDTIHEMPFLRSVIQDEEAMQPLGLRTTYAFHVHRDESEFNREETAYEYSIFSTLENTTLPRHLAEYIYGAYDDPMEFAKPVDLVNSVEFYIDTDTRDLSVVQSACYTDAKGEVIMRASSDMGHHLGSTTSPALAPESENNEEEKDYNQEYFSQPMPLQFRADASEHVEPSGAVIDSESVKWLQQELSSDVSDLDLAYFTLQSMKKTFRDTGMNI